MHNFTIKEKGAQRGRAVVLFSGNSGTLPCSPLSCLCGDDTPQGALGTSGGPWAWVTLVPSPCPLRCRSFATRFGTFGPGGEPRPRRGGDEWGD